MKNWLDVHPERDNDDAALFCILKDMDHPERDSDAQPLNPLGVNQQLRRIGERAEIDKPVNPHNFRHSAVTRMVRDGLTDQRIKWMVGWKPDSTQFERYTHLRDDKMIQGVLEHYDLEEPDAAIGKPELETCPSCDAALDSWVNPVACPGCGLSLSNKSEALVDAAEEIRETATEAAIESTDPDEITAAKALREGFGDPQQIQAKLAELEAKVDELEGE